MALEEFLSEVETLKAELATIKQELNKKSETAFRSAVQDIFDTYPGLGGFSWTQYTPYFNDGEPCTFGVSSYFDLYGLDSEGNIDLDNLLDEDAHFTEWRRQNRLDRGEEITWLDEATQALTSLIEAIPEDAMEATFGDHIKVIVSRSGVEIEEYEHD